MSTSFPLVHRVGAPPLPPRRRRLGIAALPVLVSLLLGVLALVAAPSRAAAHDGSDAVEPTGGPVIIDGTDSGLHGSITLDGSGIPKPSELNSTWYYELKAWETLLGNVPGSYANNGKVAVVGATDSTATVNNCGAAARYVSERVASGSVEIDFIEGADAISTLFDGVLSGENRYAMIQIVESTYCSNGMSAAEEAEVDANGAAIAAHVNRGGALFSQFHTYGWLSDLFPTLSASTSCSGSSPALTDAGYAQFPGLSNDHIRAPWHNCFVVSSGSFPLTQLALQDGTHTVILGGTSVAFPTTIEMSYTPSQPRPGQEICVQATVTDGGAAVEGATVQFSIDGPSTDVGADVVSDGAGIATHCYTSIDPGSETVTALVASGPGMGSMTIDYTWSELSLVAAPGVLARGDDVCVTATAGEYDGTAVVPAEGVAVSFTITGANAAGPVSVVTDTAGEAVHCFTGSRAGEDTVTASMGAGDTLDSRAILLDWSGPQVTVPDLTHEAGQGGKVVPVGLDEFTDVDVLTARLVVGADGGSLSVDATGLALTAEGGGSLTDTADLHFSGSVTDVTSALGSRITWTAPATGRDVTLTTTVTGTNTTTSASLTADTSSTLVAASAPAVSTQPAESTVTVDAGATVPITAAATGWPTPTVTWQLSEDDGVTWSTIDGAVDGTHSVETIRSTDGARFRARFANSLGFTFSDVVTLTVKGRIQTIVFPELADLRMGQDVADLGATSEADTGITYTADPAEVCTADGAALTLVAVGTCTVTAEHAGDDIHLPADPVVRSFEVLAASTGGGGGPSPERIALTEPDGDGTGALVVTAPSTGVEVHLDGFAGSGTAPVLTITPRSGDDDLRRDRGVTALSERYALGIEDAGFRSAEVCLPIDAQRFREQQRPEHRVRLLHIETDKETDVTTRIDWDAAPAMVCGASTGLGEFQVAVYAGDRLSGADRYATAAAVAQRLHPDGVETVYVATGIAHPDALSAGVAGSHAGAAVLLVARDEVPSATVTALDGLDPSRIVVLGGSAAVSESVLETLADRTGADVSRLGGRDRYETAALSARASFPGGVDTVYLATGATFPDALTSGSVAARQDATVLLTPGGTLPDTVASALKALSPSTVVVVGGERSISSGVVAQVASLVDGDVRRVAGADRYATAALLAAGSRGGHVVTTTGAAYADALVATALAASDDAPLLLVAGDEVPAATDDAIVGIAPDRLIVVGGPAALGRQAELQLTRLMPEHTPSRL